MTIKPIETIYKGYKFRSRLEARWAVFFDALDIIYEYEPEGYATKAGWYLPDFWLPETKTFIEIKPAERPLDENKMSASIDPRWEELEKQTGERFVLICGAPGRVSAMMEPHCKHHSYQGFVLCDWSYYWTECEGCGCVDIQFEGRGARNRNHHKGCVYKKGNKYGDADKNYGYNTNKLNYAYDEARQARFEYRREAKALF